MRGPTEQPAASKHRKQIIIPGYHYTNTSSVDLKLLRQFKNLQVLALPLATKAVEPDDLQVLTQLTSLTISMRRRNHLGLGKRLQCDPRHALTTPTSCGHRSQHDPYLPIAVVTLLLVSRFQPRPFCESTEHAGTCHHRPTSAQSGRLSRS